MKKELHPNYKKSSNLIFISAGLEVINILFSPNIERDNLTILEDIFVLGFMIGLGLLTRIGFSWFKYIFLTLFLISLVAIPFTIEYYTASLISGFAYIGQAVLQVWSLVLLFQVNKTTNRQTNAC